MKYLILVSHGLMADGLCDTLEMFVCKNNTIISCGLLKDMSVDPFSEQFKTKISKINKNEDEIILLADIKGGSPLTTAIAVLEETDLLSKAAFYVGMNLPMALNAACYKDIYLGGQLQSALMEGSTPYYYCFGDTCTIELVEDI